MEQTGVATAKADVEYKTYTASSETPEALVIHCGDQRFQRAFGDFLRQQCYLAPSAYIPFIIPGGPLGLVTGLLPEDVEYLERNIRFYLERVRSLKKIISINHDDCKRYHALHEKHGSNLLRDNISMGHLQRIHSLEVIPALKKIAGHPIEVRSFIASFVPGDHPHSKRIKFERIASPLV